MPELPEVEVVRRGLAEHAVGRTIAQVRVLHPRPIRRHLAGETDFGHRLSGTVITAAVRRGKFLWLTLSTGEALQTHLGMSGQWLVSTKEAPPERHLRVRLVLDGPDDAELRFVDQRMFGGLAVIDLVPTVDGLPGGAGSVQPLLPSTVAHIGRDALDPALELDRVAAGVQRRHTEIKRALLNQDIVSGIGNIYADEALWRAQVHPARMTDALTKPAIRRVYEHAQQVMRSALEQGGTSFDALYVNVNGQSGYFDRSLAAYGQEGRPCPRCSTPITRIQFMNRSSFFCRRCQPVPRTRAVGREWRA